MGQMTFNFETEDNEPEETQVEVPKEEIKEVKKKPNRKKTKAHQKHKGLY